MKNKKTTLFVALVGRIDADVTSGGFKKSGPPAQTGEIQEKLLTHKIHCNNWRKIHFLSRLNCKILGGGEHPQNYLFFVKCKRIRLKLVIFYFIYDLAVCNKKADIHD